MALLGAEINARGCALPLELGVGSGVNDDDHCGRVRTRFDDAGKLDTVHCRHRMGGEDELASWPGFKLRYRYRDTVYHIAVARDESASVEHSEHVFPWSTIAWSIGSR
jgi:hypothetical protein